MAEPEYFEKTPAKANRWFKAFIVMALLYGATFSLASFFNWTFFCAAAYCFFMSYYLLPVQPKVFQQKRREAFDYRATGGQESAAADTSGARGKKVVLIVVGVMFALFMIPFTIGFIQGLSGEGGSGDETAGSETAPGSPADFVSKGNDFFNAKDYESADIYYDSALAVDREYADAIYGKGIVRYETSRRDEAGDYFVRAYEGGLRMAWLSWVLADMYDKEGQTTKAVDLYKESVSMDSSYTESYQRLAELEPSNREMWLNLTQKHTSN